ncbi:MAG: LamG-like jellyroll fold domain-containing protein, partial [Planctomycetaceae bacterium]
MNRLTNSPIARKNIADRSGFTLIEMLVAVAVLAVMIMIFGSILNHVNSVMNIANDNIQADRETAAVAGLVQKDLARVSRTSYIRVDGNKLCVQVVGNYESLLAADSGTVSSAAARNSVTLNCTQSTAWGDNSWQGAMVRFDDRKYTGTFSATTATTGTNNANPNWVANTYVGALVLVTGGQGAGVQRTVTGNTSDTITVDPPWGLTPGTPATSDLLVYMDFNDKTLTDKSTHLNHGAGTIPSSNWVDDQDPGNASGCGLRTDGLSVVLDPTKLSTIISTTAVSVSVWLIEDSTAYPPNNTVYFSPNTPSGGHGITTAVKSWDSANGCTITYFWYATQGTAGMPYYFNPGPEHYQGPAYHHYAFVRPPTNTASATIYHNGAVYKRSGWPTSNLGGMYAGAISGYLTWHGKMDDFGMWDRPLSDDEVNLLASRQKNPLTLSGGTDVGGSGEGPAANSTYALYFPTYPVGSSATTSLTLGQSLWGDVPAGTAYSLYFSANAALIDYGRIYDGTDT